MQCNYFGPIGTQTKRVPLEELWGGWRVGGVFPSGNPPKLATFRAFLKLFGGEKNTQKTHKHFSDNPCGTIVPGTNPHPSQGQTGRFDPRTGPNLSRKGGPFVPGTVPVCPGHCPAQNVYIMGYFRRRTNVQQLTCNIDLSNYFYYIFFAFVLIELKPFVLKGKVLGKTSEKKMQKSVNNYETNLPFSCCPLVTKVSFFPDIFLSDLWFAKPILCNRVAFTKKDGNHENGENDEDNPWKP